jgi:hypothetical protein
MASRRPATLSESGALPGGVTFNAATGALSGTPPAVGTQGAYPITFTAMSGVAPNATQSFTLTVSPPIAITITHGAPTALCSQPGTDVPLYAIPITITDSGPFLLSDMVLEAHTLLKRLECIPEQEDHPDFRSPYDRTGTLECMATGVEQRTQRFKLSTLDELSPDMAPASAPGLLLDEADRYGIDKDGKLAAWQMSDPATVAENVLYRAKRILRKDKCHHRMMFIRDGQGDWHNATLFAADRTEKHLLMRQAAEFVERKGCDALIEVGEVWIEPAKPPSGGISHPASAAMGRREALFVGLWTREGLRRTSVTPFKRGPFGGIKIGDTQECDGKTMLYLEPIIEVWRKQGYIRLSDGNALRRLWEPCAHAFGTESNPTNPSLI